MAHVKCDERGFHILGEVTLDTLQEIERSLGQLPAHLPDEFHWQVNGALITRLDSAIVAVLLWLDDLAQHADQRLVLTEMPFNAVRLLDLYGLNGIFSSCHVQKDHQLMLG